MWAQETNNASEETLHARVGSSKNTTDGSGDIRRYDAEVDASLSPLRNPLVARDSGASEASSARTIRDDTAGLNKEKGGSSSDDQQGGDNAAKKTPLRRSGLLERTTSGHTRGQKRADGKVELKEKDVYDEVGFRYTDFLAVIATFYATPRKH